MPRFFSSLITSTTSRLRSTRSTCQDFFAVIDADAKRDVRGFILHDALVAHFDDKRVEKDDRPNRIERDGRSVAGFLDDPERTASRRRSTYVVARVAIAHDASAHFGRRVGLVRHVGRRRSLRCVPPSRMQICDSLPPRSIAMCRMLRAT